MVKSEVLENLEEQEKNIAELSSQVEDLRSSAMSAGNKKLFCNYKNLENSCHSSQKEYTATPYERKALLVVKINIRAAIKNKGESYLCYTTIWAEGKATVL